MKCASEGPWVRRSLSKQSLAVVDAAEMLERTVRLMARATVRSAWTTSIKMLARPKGEMRPGEKFDAMKEKMSTIPTGMGSTEGGARLLETVMDEVKVEGIAEVMVDVAMVMARGRMREATLIPVVERMEEQANNKRVAQTL